MTRRVISFASCSVSSPTRSLGALITRLASERFNNDWSPRPSRHSTQQQLVPPAQPPFNATTTGPPGPAAIQRNNNWSLQAQPSFNVTTTGPPRPSRHSNSTPSVFLKQRLVPQPFSLAAATVGFVQAPPDAYPNRQCAAAKPNIPPATPVRVFVPPCLKLPPGSYQDRQARSLNPR
ncbi:MAG: hypothetical protein ACI81R_001437 [Bradymonadia bacterium]|jgi:hypothetical protein